MGCAQLTGSVELLGHAKRTTCAFGMVLGEHGKLVGQFGAVVVAGGQYVCVWRFCVGTLRRRGIVFPAYG